MTFYVEVKTDNAAFGDDEEERARELARLLADLAERFRNHPPETDESGNLRDHNGNAVGRWFFEE